MNDGRVVVRKILIGFEDIIEVRTEERKYHANVVLEVEDVEQLNAPSTRKYLNFLLRKVGREEFILGMYSIFHLEE